MKQSGSGKSLFLLEIGILILFFIAAMVACTSLFVYSHEKNKEAGDLNHAVITAASLADTIKAQSPEVSEKAPPATGRIYYNSQWQSQGSPVYYADIHSRQKGTLLTTEISIYRVEDEMLLYQLETKTFLGVRKK